MASLKVAEDLKNFIRDLLYPVGTIYICDNETNPGTRFGGTWVMVPSGHLFSQTAGGALMSTGGGTTTGSTAITLAQMFSHTHIQNSNYHNVTSRMNSNGTDNGSGFGIARGIGGGANFYDLAISGVNNSEGDYGGNVKVGVLSTTATNQNAGSSQAHTHPLDLKELNMYGWICTT